LAATQSSSSGGLLKSLGTRDVFVAGTALVVATSTLVTDFIGYFTLGLSFAMAILVAFVINLALGLSATELAVAYPKAGAIYEYGRDVFSGTIGRLAGIFLGLTFVGMFVLVGPGETAAGGFGLQALFNTDSGLNWFIVILVVLAAIPNILGIRVAAVVSAALLFGMLVIRWVFGIAGFLSIGDVGSWSSDNLNTGGPGAWDWFGDNGLLALGLVMAFWSFVGIEFVCSLTEEVDNPRKAMPRGIIYGLLALGLFVYAFGFGESVLSAGLVGVFLYSHPEYDGCLSLPFFKEVHPDLGWGYIPLAILVIVGASNAVNLTDGLDGLATGPVVITASVYLIFSYLAGNRIFADYLQIPHVPGAGEVAVFCAALAGAALGFLWFNAYPAEIFMGDTGSLALGGLLGAVSIIIKQEILLAIVGGIFVLEALSVIVQVGYFKLSGGRRIFLMAPFHHHFEKKGWPESKVVIRFWIVSIILGLVALATLKLR